MMYVKIIFSVECQYEKIPVIVGEGMEGRDEL